MLFVEFIFLPFFVTVFVVHWLLPSHTEIGRAHV